MEETTHILDKKMSDLTVRDNMKAAAYVTAITVVTGMVITAAPGLMRKATSKVRHMRATSNEIPEEKE